jgi:hopene-associated glycosyltransferase HpnB
LILGTAAWLALAVWLYLIFAHGAYWRSRPELTASVPDATPDVDIIVPARDEAATIRPVIASLLAQDYHGRFRVILVDDGSSDDTAGIARSAAPGGDGEGSAGGAAAGDPGVAGGGRSGVAGGGRLTVVSLTSKPPGWSGKLWAVAQGVAAGRAPLLLLTDADIVHDPRHLATLVARQSCSSLDLVSEMVHLNCSSFAERALVPAFVYFFQMLYPFAMVNDPRSKIAAAAGGTMLVRREALERIGGIESIRGALIDDVTLAKSIKRHGPVYLGHTALAASIRPYPGCGEIWRMISRTAFTQLRYSPVLLAATVAGMALVWLVPVYGASFAAGYARLAGIAAFGLSIVSYQPTLRRYGRNPLWALALPLIALFYAAATIGSAIDHWRGTGATWKSRAYPREQ